jgi:predicted transcriptional regulator
MGGKTEVYSWRLTPALKASLEEAARRDRRSVSQVLEEVVTDHLARARPGSDAATQRRLHAKAHRFAGRISGTDPGRAANARRLIRQRLRRRRAR